MAYMAMYHSLSTLHEEFKENSRSVFLCKAESNYSNVMREVPQGSVLGPLLFIRPHINSIVMQITLKMLPYSVTKQLQDSLREGVLKKITDLTSLNFLKLNADKTEVTVFSTEERRLRGDALLDYLSLKMMSEMMFV